MIESLFAGDLTELFGIREGGRIVINEYKSRSQRLSGRTCDDIPKIYAKIIKTLSESSVKCCPSALNLHIINPVNLTIPISCEVPDETDISGKRRILGVITLDIVRAKTFIEEIVPGNKALCRTIAELPPAHPANPARMTHRNEAQVFISFQIKFTISDSILRASQGEMMV